MLLLPAIIITKHLLWHQVLYSFTAGGGILGNCSPDSIPAPAVVCFRVCSHQECLPYLLMAGIHLAVDSIKPLQPCTKHSYPRSMLRYYVLSQCAVIAHAEDSSNIKPGRSSSFIRVRCILLY